MAKHDIDGVVTEPFAVPDLFVTTASIERNSHVLRFVGMVRLPRINADKEELRQGRRAAVDAGRRGARASPRSDARGRGADELNGPVRQPRGAKIPGRRCSSPGEDERMIELDDLIADVDAAREIGGLCVDDPRFFKELFREGIADGLEPARERLTPLFHNSTRAVEHYQARRSNLIAATIADTIAHEESNSLFQPPAGFSEEEGRLFRRLALRLNERMAERLIKERRKDPDWSYEGKGKQLKKDCAQAYKEPGKRRASHGRPRPYPGKPVPAEKHLPLPSVKQIELCEARQRLFRGARPSRGAPDRPWPLGAVPSPVLVKLDLALAGVDDAPQGLEALMVELIGERAVRLRTKEELRKDRIFCPWYEARLGALRAVAWAHDMLAAESRAAGFYNAMKGERANLDGDIREIEKHGCESRRFRCLYYGAATTPPVGVFVANGPQSVIDRQWREVADKLNFEVRYGGPDFSLGDLSPNPRDFSLDDWSFETRYGAPSPIKPPIKRDDRRVRFPRFCEGDTYSLEDERAEAVKAGLRRLRSERAAMDDWLETRKAYGAAGSAPTRNIWAQSFITAMRGTWFRLTGRSHKQDSKLFALFVASAYRDAAGDGRRFAWKPQFQAVENSDGVRERGIKTYRNEQERKRAKRSA